MGKALSSFEDGAITQGSVHRLSEESLNTKPRHTSWEQSVFSEKEQSSLLAGEAGIALCHGKWGPDSYVIGVNCTVDTLIKNGNTGCEYKEQVDLVEFSSAWLGELAGMINSNKSILWGLFYHCLRRLGGEGADLQLGRHHPWLNGAQPQSGRFCALYFHVPHFCEILVIDCVYCA